MRRIRSTDLAIFLAIAQHRSFRKAAVELGVTASALSHSLRAIEERLDVRLVNRTTRGVGLTEAGERLFDRIRPAFLDIDDALEDLDKFRGQPYGKLRINAPRAAAKTVLLPIISRFLRAYPAVEMEVVVDDALVDTVAGGFDAGSAVRRKHRRRHDRHRYRPSPADGDRRLTRAFSAVPQTGHAA